MENGFRAPAPVELTERAGIPAPAAALSLLAAAKKHLFDRAHLWS
jgi:hypothetical protein